MEVRFRLNPKNEKDKTIIEFLEAEYSATDTIKSLLYKVATNNFPLNCQLRDSKGVDSTDNLLQQLTTINDSCQSGGTLNTNNQVENIQEMTRIDENEPNAPQEVKIDTTGFEDFFN